MYISSELILLGSTNRPGMLIAGGALALSAFALSVYLALRPSPEHPRPPIFLWALAGVAAFYVISAAAASLVDPEYGLPALAAGIIPMTAVSLLLATLRSKTVVSDGHLQDLSAADHEDPFPGIGMDDLTPLGDTPEHSEALTCDPAITHGPRARRLR
jgi:hypothetical protein